MKLLDDYIEAKKALDEYDAKTKEIEQQIFAGIDSNMLMTRNAFKLHTQLTNRYQRRSDCILREFNIAKKKLIERLLNDALAQHEREQIRKEQKEDRKTLIDANMTSDKIFGQLVELGFKSCESCDNCLIFIKQDGQRVIKVIVYPKVIKLCSWVEGVAQSTSWDVLCGTGYFNSRELLKAIDLIEKRLNLIDNQ